MNSNVIVKGFHAWPEKNYGMWNHKKTTEDSPIGSRFRSCDTIEVGRNKRLMKIFICNFLLII